MIKNILQVFKNNKLAKIAIVVAILMPAIFGGIFLGSMWDPYGYSGNLPVAVVNYDHKVEFKGNKLDVGNKLVEKLKDNKELKFQFVDADTASEGLRSGKFYMIITIPKNFSANAATLLDEEPKQMQLEYKTNPGINFLGSMVTTSAMGNISTAVQKQVTKQYSKALFSVIENLDDGLKKAQDGSKKVANGVNNLREGYDKMKKKTNSLQSGSDKLLDGAENLDHGVNKLQSGISNLYSGTNSLSSGVHALSLGNNKLGNGVNNLVSGTKNLENGVNTYVKGVGKAYAGTKTMISKNDTIKNNLSVLSTNTGKLKKGSESLVSGINQLQKSVSDNLTEDKTKQLNTLITNLPSLNTQIITLSEEYNTMTESERIAAIKQIAGMSSKMLPATQNAVEGLQTALTNIKSGTDKIKTGATALDSGISTLATGINGDDGTGETNGLVYGINSYLDGAKVLSKNIKKLNNKSSKLTSGVNNLKNGVQKLSTNSKKSKKGVTKLEKGTQNLVEGVSKLKENSTKLGDGTTSMLSGVQNMHSGIPKLLNGMQKMDKGISKLEQGTDKLSAKISRGVNAADSNLKYVDEDTVKMVASPVKTKKSELTSVDNMGNSMAAFLLSVGLWVGAMTFCMMYPIKEWTPNIKNGVMEWLSKAIIFIPVSVIWGLAIVPLINLFLNINPDNAGHTLLVSAIGAITFVSIVYFINILIGKPATGVILILLVLQLSSAGGIFPVEMTSKFYRIMHPFMPFTYTVTAFRSTIANGNSITLPCSILIGITIVVNILSILILQTKYRKDKQNNVSVNQELAI